MAKKKSFVRMLSMVVTHTVSVTFIASYATAKESASALNLISQAMTRDFWDNGRQKYRLCVSRAGDNSGSHT
jgi:hypothetical protein